MTARTLMVQGTGSSVGKSTLVAGLCRIFMQDGLRVAPFKAQNMSNNAYVTPDGREIGRSQAEQAAAAGTEPSTAMNPILLKPEGDQRSQLVLNGLPVGSYQARDYYARRDSLWPDVTAALDSLREQFDVVVIEGAGSPAEVNLRDRDITNMEVALYAQSPVLLAGDIDRGGVFASLLGTLELLRDDERALVRGLVINKFRGDRSLLEPLPSMIASRTGVPVVGVVPMIPDLRLKEEDGMSLERAAEIADQGPMIACVVRLPRISNFDDFDPLSRAGVSVRFVTRPEELTDAHMVLLPGSKNTIADLRWMKSRGLDQAIAAAAERGSTVIGLCAGYQMLGRRLIDPDGSDGGTPASEDGLGLLDLTTRFSAEKTTARVDFSMAPAAVAGGWRGGERGTGYEIHSGASSPEGDDTFLPLVRIVDRNGRAREDGRISKQGNVMGCYIHGFLDSPDVLQPLLVTVAAKAGLSAPRADTFSMDSEFDRLAAVMREALDMKLINQITGL